MFGKVGSVVSIAQIGDLDAIRIESEAKQKAESSEFSHFIHCYWLHNN